MTGYGRHASGLAAEEAVSRLYVQRGAKILERRYRTPEGEIDIILHLDGVIVFVEVKHRRAAQALERAVSERQWQRLADAATRYIMDVANETGRTPVCRFDLALVGPNGLPEIIENARGFEQY